MCACVNAASGDIKDRNISFCRYCNNMTYIWWLSQKCSVTNDLSFQWVLYFRINPYLSLYWIYFKVSTTEHIIGKTWESITRERIYNCVGSTRENVTSGKFSSTWLTIHVQVASIYFKVIFILTIHDWYSGNACSQRRENKWGRTLLLMSIYQVRFYLKSV